MIDNIVLLNQCNILINREYLENYTGNYTNIHVFDQKKIDLSEYFIDIWITIKIRTDDFISGSTNSQKQKANVLKRILTISVKKSELIFFKLVFPPF